MKTIGRVDVPQEAFVAALSTDQNAVDKAKSRARVGACRSPPAARVVVAGPRPNVWGAPPESRVRVECSVTVPSCRPGKDPHVTRVRGQLQ